MKIITSIIMIISIGMLSSCSDGSGNHDSSIAKMESSRHAVGAPPTYAISSVMDGDSPNVAEARIQINGTLSMQVPDISGSIDKTQILVGQYNGKVTSSHSGDSYNRYANITVLVPKESFYELLSAVKNIATKVTDENINSNDVTEEFIDVEAKLNVMKQTENRFLALLSETTNIKEIIDVEKEVMRIRGDIDSLEGRIKYLTKTTDNSVLNIYMVEELPITGSEWNFSDSLDSSVRALASFSKHLVNFIIDIIVFSPIIIGAGLLSFLVYKFSRKFIFRIRK